LEFHFFRRQAKNLSLFPEDEGNEEKRQIDPFSLLSPLLLRFPGPNPKISSS